MNLNRQKPGFKNPGPFVHSNRELTPAKIRRTLRAWQSNQRANLPWRWTAVRRSQTKAERWRHPPERRCRPNANPPAPLLPPPNPGFCRYYANCLHFSKMCRNRPVATGQPQPAERDLQAAGRGLQAAGCLLQATGCSLLATGGLLQAAKAICLTVRRGSLSAGAPCRLADVPVPLPPEADLWLSIPKFHETTQGAGASAARRGNCSGVFVLQIVSSAA